MAKWVNPATLDAALNAIKAANKMAALSGSATTYGEASGKILAEVAMAPGDFSLEAGTPDGRTLRVLAKTGVPISNDGTANHVALLNSSTSTLLYVTTTPAPVTLETSGTLNFDAWTVTIGEPV